jgi:uncharacterized protein involved in exopolysaccharide biosynthesis
MVLLAVVGPSWSSRCLAQAADRGGIGRREVDRPDRRHGDVRHERLAMATQAEVLRSERVALRALELLRLNESRAQRAAWQRATEGQGDFRGWLADTLAANLVVKPARDANVISVSYTAGDPVLAAGVANAIVDATPAPRSI